MLHYFFAPLCSLLYCTFPLVRWIFNSQVRKIKPKFKCSIFTVVTFKLEWIECWIIFSASLHVWKLSNEYSSVRYEKLNGTNKFDIYEFFKLDALVVTVANCNFRISKITQALEMRDQISTHRKQQLKCRILPLVSVKLEWIFVNQFWKINGSLLLFHISEFF